MNLDDDNLPITTDTSWSHCFVSFPEGHGVTPEAAAALLEGLADQSFWFLRKRGQLRLRTKTPVGPLLDRLVAEGLASGWNGGIYEPEERPFGGPEGMEVTYTLFCADSPGALADTGRPGNRERCVLLISAMCRGAGLDRFETGDVWAKLAAERHRPERALLPSGDRLVNAVKTMRRLMNADGAQIPDADEQWQQRVAAFHHAGRELAILADAGTLKRGLRAVLAHHAIFAFNRSGIDGTEQAAAAWLAEQVAFSGDETTIVPTAWSPPHAPRVGEMETTLTPDTTDLAQARAQAMKDEGWLRTPAIEQAFLNVDRHHYVPDVDAVRAYLDDSVHIKENDAGTMISCASAPTIVITQLEQLDAQPGHKILEGGAATGYNAALLGHLVGPTGHVYTLDVDEDLVDGARRNLQSDSVTNVTALLGDAAAGLPQYAPYDRIQFTVGTGDLPANVMEQLAPGGRIVIPMRIRGSISRSFAWERDGEFWRTTSTEMATFVPMRKGILDDNQMDVPFDGPGDVYMEVFAEQDIDLDVLRPLLDLPGHTVWTDYKIRKLFPWQWLYLWMTCTLPNGLSRLPGRRPDFTGHFTWGSMGTVEHGSLAYLTLREDDDEISHYWQIGVTGHGPNADTLVKTMVDIIHDWDSHGGNDMPQPTFRAALGDARNRLDVSGARFVIDKPASRIAVDWPDRT
jgi:protein-L-isoaspartate(D-aspartate) O-methyltransferase